MSTRFFNLFSCIILFLSALTVFEPNVLALSPPQEVSAPELYRVRLVISTTSDWTSVRLVGGAELGGIRLELLRGQGARNLTYSSDVTTGLLLAIGKKQYDQTRVEIQTTLTMLGLEPTNSLTIQIEKGDVGQTVLSIYNYNGDLPSLTRTFTDSVSGKHPNRAQLSMIEKDLMNGGPLLGRSTEFSKMVWALYYPWYDASSWNSPRISDKPVMGDYSSSDAATIQRHIRMAKSAGIDGFLVSWCTDWCPSHNLDTILDIASKENFKISVYLETLVGDSGPAHPRTKANLESMLMYFFQHYDNDDRYFHFEGRPVIFVFAAVSQSIETWQQIFGDLNRSGYEGLYVGEIGWTSDVGYLQVFDGIHIYWPWDRFQNLDTSDRALSQAVRSYALLYPELGAHNSKLWSATISPGLDARKIPEEEPWYFPREDGATYQQTFDAALQSNPDWIIVTSFNEWWENTYIEPSETYGWKYIDLTTVYSSEFKEVKFLPSLEVSRKVSIEGQEGKIDVIAVNRGNGSAINVVAKDFMLTGTESAESVDRILPGEDLHYAVPFKISADQISLQLPPGEVTSVDAYGNAHHVTTGPVLQYYLTIVSPYGSPSGAGWYEANSTASLSVSLTPVPMDGILGMLGARYVFDRWSGDLTTVSSNATVVMDGPKIIRVLWHADYTEPHAIVGTVSILILFAAALIYIKTRRSHQEKAHNKGLKRSLELQRNPLSLARQCGVEDGFKYLQTLRDNLAGQ